MAWKVMKQMVSWSEQHVFSNLSLLAKGICSLLSLKFGIPGVRMTCILLCCWLVLTSEVILWKKKKVLYRYVCPPATKHRKLAFEFSFWYTLILTILCKKHRDCQLLQLWLLKYFIVKHFFQLLPTYATPDKYWGELILENFWWHYRSCCS